MELEWMMKTLRRCHVEGGGEKGGAVFLVARDDEPPDPARDKDIWSLVGPVTLEDGVPQLQPPRETLEDVQGTLDGIDTTGSPSGCGQQLFVLVQDARDKDIWSLTGPLLSGELVGTFTDPFQPGAGWSAAQARDRVGTRGDATEAIVTTGHLVISIRNIEQSMSTPQ